MTRGNCRRLGRLTTLGLVAAAGLLPPAAGAVDLRPQVLVPPLDDSRQSFDPWIYTSEGLLRPDGSVAWPTLADNANPYGRGIWLRNLDLLAVSPQWTSVFAAGSDQLGIGDRYVTLAAYRGSDWFVSQPAPAPGSIETTPIPATPTLVSFNDRGAVTRRIELPVRGTSAIAAALLPGGRGLRVLMEGGSDAGNKVYLADERGRVRTRLPQLQGAITGAALADGSLVIAGWTRVTARPSRSPLTLLRVSAAGHVRPIDQASSPQPPFTFTTFEPAYGGVLATTQLTEGSDTRVHLIRGTRTVKSVPASSLEFPRSPECLASSEHWISVDSVMTGPSGQPIVRASCNEEGDRGPNVLQRVVLGLDGNLRVRWHADAAPFSPTLVGPDGRMLQVGAEGVVAAREPGALLTRRGELLRVTRGGSTRATATIRCDRPYGTVCNGRIIVRAGGRTVGAAIYAAPGRPGRAAATIRRTIQLSAPSSGRLTAKLVPRTR